MSLQDEFAVRGFESFDLNYISAPSWPGLSRPSTPFCVETPKKDVDARDKRGHDAEKTQKAERLTKLYG
jgi:hypothetical protein